MKDFKRETEVTSDGSVTLYIPEIDEHYHSTNGAFIEADHVYINAAFMHYVKSNDADNCINGSEADTARSVNILEVGFGTGLNAFLTMLKCADEKIKVHYVTLELYPLDKECTESLNYPELISPENAGFFKDIHNAEWNKAVRITDTFTIEKRKLNLVTDKVDGCFDVVYYDAFAPEKQPEMWNDGIYNKIAGVMNNGAVLTTYCAKGIVRRGLRDAGLTMVRMSVYLGETEMLRGTLLVR